MVATRGRTFKRPWRRSCLSSKLKSSSAPIGRRDSGCFRAVGSSNAPLRGSTAAEGLPRIGRTSIATRWRSCGLPQSASCSENFVIPPDVSGQTLKATKTFLRWCVGRAVLDQSPAEGVPLPSKEVARDRVLDDEELAQVILAARQIGGPYGGIVELLALTGQRREEVARLSWGEIDLGQRLWTIPKSRTKNAKAHIVHLSHQSMAVLKGAHLGVPLVFSLGGTKPFQEFSRAKCLLDRFSGVTGWR